MLSSPHPCPTCGTRLHNNYVCISCMEPQARQDLMEESIERADRSWLSLRDKFAMAALTGLVSKISSDEDAFLELEQDACKTYVETAYWFADAMIAERERKP